MIRGQSPLIAGLAVTQTVGYGVLYYAFSVVLVPIAEDLHTSTAVVAGALTLSIVVSAAAAAPVGRWLDHHDGRWLMTGGSLLGVATVVAWSQVRATWQLYPVFVLIGLSSAACLYETAFPVLVAATRPEQRNRALLTVTVVAGFASTIFFPLTGLLVEHVGWRTALLVLAAMLALVTVPLHAVVVPSHTPGRTGSHRAGDDVRRALSDPRFWRLSAAFVAHAAAVSAVGVLLVSYLRHAGHPPTVAASLSGLLGVLSVAGRLVTTAVASRHGMAVVAGIVFVVQAVGIATLPHVGASTVGAAACVTAFGLGFGVATIARPAIVADRYGTHRYATIMSAITLPMTLTKAAAPTVAAGLQPTTFLTTAGVLCLAAAALLWTRAGASPWAQALSGRGSHVRR